MDYALTLKEITPVTHDTRRLVVTRPDDFTFQPGQAVELAIDRSGWRDEGRPFTMTSLPGDDDLEFIIKIYPSHDGVTEQIATLSPGDVLLCDGPFGAITDQGPGTFIAGGAGITPFIALLRNRDRDNALHDCQLIFSNKAERDIILRDDWAAMKGLSTTFVVTDETPADGLLKGPIDRTFLSPRVAADAGMFYLCGPQPMVDDVRDALRDLDVATDRIITEEGW